MNRRGFLGALAVACLAPLATMKKATAVSRKIVLFSAKGHANWRNYASAYTSVNKEEFLQASRMAIKDMEFKPPIAR